MGKCLTKCCCCLSDVVIPWTAFASSRSKICIKAILNSNIVEVAENQDWMKEKEKEYQNLNEHIQAVCLKNKLNNHTPYLWRTLMVEKNKKIAYCRNAKVGTTTWMNHFNDLLDPKHRISPEKKQNIDLHNFIPPKFSIHKQIGVTLDFKSTKKYLSDNEYLTFSFVRHPFDRIVSAYKDKAEEKGNTYELKRELRFRFNIASGSGYVKWNFLTFCTLPGTTTYP